MCDDGENCFLNHDAVEGKCSVTLCDGIVVMGSTNQPQLNGCYQDRNHSIHGFPSYDNSRGFLLSWEQSGKWSFGARIGDQPGFTDGTDQRGYASGTGGAGPAAISPKLWMTYNRSVRRWQHEKLFLSSGACAVSELSVHVAAWTFSFHYFVPTATSLHK